jgi:hypothetical protein
MLENEELRKLVQHNLYHPGSCVGALCEELKLSNALLKLPFKYDITYQ